jgi:hypothetical protein
MKRRTFASVRYLLFCVFVLVTVAGPGPPIRPSAVRPVGVGCRGAGAGAGAARAVGAMRAPPRVALPGNGVKMGIREPFLPKVRIPEPTVGLEVRPLPRVLSIHAAEGNWEDLHLAIPKKLPLELPDGAGRHLNAIESEARNLRALTEFRQRLGVVWPEGNGQSELDWLAVLEANTPAEEVGQVRQYLGLRAHLEGRSDIAKRLLGTETLPDGRKVLRDLKVLGATPAPPPPAESLGGLPLPEPEPLSWRPGVKEKLGQGLPELEKEIPEAEMAARRRVLGTIERSAFRHSNHLTIHLYNLQSISNVLRSEDNDSDKRNRFPEIETRLGRRLKPEERLLARHLLRTSSPEEVAARLSTLDEAGR